MKYSFLGKSGLKVSRLSFGNWVTANDEANHQSQIDIIKRAYELGINFFDTAETYGYGKGEEALGKAIKALNVPRNKLVISTKIFWSTPNTERPVNENGLSRKHIFEGIRASLKRLDLEYVDIVFCHRFDYDVELEEICKSMNDVVEKGYAFYWGTSEWPAALIAAANELCARFGWHAPVAEQCQYNMLVRDKMEKDYLPLFARYKTGTTVWSPLAYGLLSGRYNDGNNTEGRLTDNNLWERHMSAKKKDRTLKILAELAEYAKSLGVTQAQLCLAWVLANSATSTCILGASKKQQLEENVKSLELLASWKKEYDDKIDDILGNKPEAEVNYKHDPRPTLSRHNLLLTK